MIQTLPENPAGVNVDFVQKRKKISGGLQGLCKRLFLGKNFPSILPIDRTATGLGQAFWCKKRAS
jgi:hypothetical protein